MTEKIERRPTISPEGQRRPGSPPPPASNGKKGAGKNKKIANGLVALGSAAILSVYGLGYAHTQSAEASLTTDSPTVAIATAAPTATSAAVPAQTTAPYQSPLFAPPAIASGAAPTATAASPAAPAAPATVVKTPATATAPTATTATYKDGTYTGTGTGRHGSIAAAVVIQGGKIVSADITQCGTRYPCSMIASLPGRVVAGQSATVDLVSGATDSSQAYQGAIKNALAKATVAA